MPNFNFVLLYVSDPLKSAEFYAKLLGKPVREAAPGFAMLPLREGVMLGLWLRSEVEPKATSAAGASEIAFAVGGDAEVTSLHTAWKGQGLAIAQPPVKMDFGYTFTALDPDGHRLRVFAPAG